MNLVIANDDGRLSEHSALQLPGVEQIYALSARRETFLDATHRQTSPFVLAWHEVASKALDLLGEIKGQGAWPEMLTGVILFRAADYAGYASREEAEEAIQAQQLDEERIHILSSAVSSPPLPRVVTRFCNFAHALRSNQSTRPPFFLLEPDEARSGIFTVYTLAAAVAAGIRVPKDVIGALDWEEVLKQCSRFGIGECPPKASWAAMTAVADQLRETSHEFIFPKLCSSCDKCRTQGHTYLERLIPSQIEPQRNAMIDEVCSELKVLAAESQRLPEIAASRALEKLGESFRLPLAPVVFELMRLLFARKCVLLRNAERILQAIADMEPALRSSSVSNSEVSDLADLVRCEDTGEVLI